VCCGDLDRKTGYNSIGSFRGERAVCRCGEKSGITHHHCHHAQGSMGSDLLGEYQVRVTGMEQGRQACKSVIWYVLKERRERRDPGVSPSSLLVAEMC
jgi:hypothetical protein